MLGSFVASANVWSNNKKQSESWQESEIEDTPALASLRFYDRIYVLPDQLEVIR